MTKRNYYFWNLEKQILLLKFKAISWEEPVPFPARVWTLCTDFSQELLVRGSLLGLRTKKGCVESERKDMFSGSSRKWFSLKSETCFIIVCVFLRHSSADFLLENFPVREELWNAQVCHKLKLHSPTWSADNRFYIYMLTDMFSYNVFLIIFSSISMTMILI